MLDLGCGSGAMALAIARERPRASVLGTDVAPAAIGLPAATRSGSRSPTSTFLASDWFEIRSAAELRGDRANPPYVAEADPHLEQGDLRFEPPLALTPGADGLSAIRSIVTAAPAYLAPGGALALEHGHDQAEAVRALLGAEGFGDVRSARDFAGILRVTSGRRSITRRRVAPPRTSPPRARAPA